MNYVVKVDSCWTDALNMVAFFEGLRLRPYLDICNHLTVGYGHRLRVGESHAPIDKTKAMALLVDDFGDCVDYLHSHFPYLWETQLFALASLSYNLGYSWMSKDRNLGREVSALNNSQRNGYTSLQLQFNVKWYFKKYVHCKDKNGRPYEVAGLVKRRNVEIDFFDGKIQNFKEYLFNNRLWHALENVNKK